MKYPLAIIASMFVALSAFAQNFETVTLPGLKVSAAETKSLKLKNARYIRNLVVQAEGVDGNSEVEVMVNGVVKGSIYAPGKDPSYVITVGETARSVEFRHRAGSALRILDVKATLSEWQGSSAEQNFHGSESEAAQFARDVITVLGKLKPYVNPEDEGQYLWPIRNQANYVLIYLDVKGSTSEKAHNALMALIDQIDFAKEYIEDLMQTDATFDYAIELLTLREKIQDRLD